MTVQTLIDPVELAQLTLRDACATGDPKRIDKAALALERAREGRDRAGSRAQDKARAEHEVIAERNSKEIASKKTAADRAEALLREQGLPYAVIYTATGQTVRVDLSRSEQVARGTAAEACKRICLRVSNAYQERRIATRNAGAVAPAVDVVTPMLSNSSDLLQAHRFGVVEVK